MCSDSSDPSVVDCVRELWMCRWFEFLHQMTKNMFGWLCETKYSDFFFLELSKIPSKLIKCMRSFRETGKTDDDEMVSYFKRSVQVTFVIIVIFYMTLLLHYCQKNINEFDPQVNHSYSSSKWRIRVPFERADIWSLSIHYCNKVEC